MDKPSIAEVSRKLFTHNTTQSRQNSIQVKDHLPDKTANIKSTLTILKENIQSQEKERIKNRHEREIKKKESTINDLAKKIQSIEKEHKNLSKVKKNQEIQNQQLKEGILKIQKQFEKKEKQMKSDCQKSILDLKDEVQKLKNMKSKLQVQNQNCKISLSKASKQYKVSFRRLNENLQQTKKQLSSKLQVKQKQLLKVQKMLETKKAQFEQILSQKDSQIIDLYEQIDSLKRKHDFACQQMKSQKKLYLQELSYLQVKIEDKSVAIKQQQARQNQLLEKLRALSSFRQELSLVSKETDILELFIKFKEELKPRRLTSKTEQQIAALEIELQTSKTRQTQLKNAIELLQQQVKFYRHNKHQNQQFTKIIRDHISNNQPKTVVRPLEKTFKKNQDSSHFKKSTINQISNEMQKNKDEVLRRTITDNVFNQRLSSFDSCKNKIDTILNRKNERVHSNNANDRLKYNSIQNYNPYSNLHEKNAFQHIQIKDTVLKSASYSVKKAKDSIDFLKEQLSSKKRSLVYLLYRNEGQDNKASSKSKGHLKAINNLTPIIKRRSNSLNQLVSAKCKERML